MDYWRGILILGLELLDQRLTDCQESQVHYYQMQDDDKGDAKWAMEEANQKQKTHKGMQ